MDAKKRGAEQSIALFGFIREIRGKVPVIAALAFTH